MILTYYNWNHILIRKNIKVFSQLGFREIKEILRSANSLYDAAKILEKRFNLSGKIGKSDIRNISVDYPRYASFMQAEYYYYAIKELYEYAVTLPSPY